MFIIKDLNLILTNEMRRWNTLKKENYMFVKISCLLCKNVTRVKNIDYGKLIFVIEIFSLDNTFRVVCSNAAC